MDRDTDVFGNIYAYTHSHHGSNCGGYISSLALAYGSSNCNSYGNCDIHSNCNFDSNCNSYGNAYSRAGTLPHQGQHQHGER